MADKWRPYNWQELKRKAISGLINKSIIEGVSRDELLIEVLEAGAAALLEALRKKGTRLVSGGVAAITEYVPLELIDHCCVVVIPDDEEMKR